MLRAPVTPREVTGALGMLRAVPNRKATMFIQIAIDTSELSDLDRALLEAIAGGGRPKDNVMTLVKESVARKPTPRKEPTPIQEPLPEPEVVPSATETVEAVPEVTPEPEKGPGPSLPVTSMEEVVKQAAELISSGERDRVKAALDSIGAKRVSEITLDQVADFLMALTPGGE